MGRANGTLELRRMVSGTDRVLIKVALLAAGKRRYARHGESVLGPKLANCYPQGNPRTQIFVDPGVCVEMGEWAWLAVPLRTLSERQPDRAKCAKSRVRQGLCQDCEGNDTCD